MHTACTCHDTCVNKVMRDLVELKMACNVKCPRQPSLTIRSRAWLLDIGGDLLVQRLCRHGTADLKVPFTYMVI